MMLNNYKSDIMKLPEDTIDIFRKILENDLIAYATEISKTHNILLEDILPLISNIMGQPMQSKIQEKYRDTSNLEYRRDLNRFTIQDLKFIATKNQLTTSGNKSELIEKISIKIGLRDITLADIKMSKSFISTNIKKKKPNKSSNEVIINNIIDDSD
jgi:hypothetical protein